MKSRKQEIIGILLCVVALFVFLSFLTHDPSEHPSGLSSDIAKNNYMGIAGIYVSHFLMRLTFGWGTLFFPLIMGILELTHAFSMTPISLLLITTPSMCRLFNISTVFSM